MKRMIRALPLAIVACLASATALAGPEDPPSALEMTGDVLIARPVGVVITAVGTAMFVVSLPFSALGGNVGQSADALVVQPAAETFVRCLGCRSAGRHQNPGA